MEANLPATNGPTKRSGMLALLLPPDDSSTPLGIGNSPAPVQVYAHFKVSRGYIDDLNRILPIRQRINLEAEISRGTLTGPMQLRGSQFHWAFRPS